MATVWNSLRIMFQNLFRTQNIKGTDPALAPSRLEDPRQSTVQSSGIIPASCLRFASPILGLLYTGSVFQYSSFPIISKVDLEFLK